MKKYFILGFGTLLLLLMSCKKDLREDIDDLLERVSKLEKICEQANTDISSLKQIVSLMEMNDYITSVNELADKSGYAINFLKGNTIVIKHGSNGDYPVVGVEELEGIFYWTQKVGDQPSSWILDSKGNKIQATGVNGKTPVIGINTSGNWTVDYGEGPQTLLVNGKPVPAKGKDGVDGTDGRDGEDGIDGANGRDGYSPFKSVTDKEEYVEIELTTGTILKLLKWDTKIMKIIFAVDPDNNLIAKKLYLNEEVTIQYKIENPDPLASIYFEATNGWMVEHDQSKQSITLIPYAALTQEGRIIASVVKNNILISQFRYLAATYGEVSSLNNKNINTSPNPLEAIAGEVAVTINITFPERWFPSQAVITVIPVLRYQEGETLYTATTLQGEKIKGNHQIIPYQKGANVTIKSSCGLKPEMKISELYLTFKAEINGKKVTIPEIKIADGVIF